MGAINFDSEIFNYLNERKVFSVSLNANDNQYFKKIISTFKLHAVVLRAIFTEVSKSIWFCITTPQDWLKKLTPLLQPIRSDSLAHVFRCFA